MLIAATAALLVLYRDALMSWGRRSRSAPLDEAAWLGAVASELRAGASVRSAIVNAATAASDHAVVRAQRLAQAGAPMEEIAVAVQELPENGRRLAAALQVVGRSGGRSAQVFDGLADRAVEAVRRSRERRALTTQVRLSAIVVAGLPLLSLFLGGAGRIGRLVTSGSAGATLAAIGAGMQIVGVVAVWRMARV